MSDGNAVLVASVDLKALPILHRLRRAVFIEGQQVPEELEIDGRDERCLHFLATLDGRPVGCARMREESGAAKAERVAVLASHRGEGVGRALMRALEASAAEADFAEVVLHAQEEVIVFYERLGYRAEGPLFEEAGIMHRQMRKPLGPARG